mmetsp:Transcript_7931/g.16092  ORF Transcript_7931/g.16092 Transcript_7931/m.16092 type:complete len:288 (-) Transcript_7931:32-895(-)
MAIISKRKRALLVAALAAGFSNAFIVSPSVKVLGPELRTTSPNSFSGRTKWVRPLEFFWNKEGETTTIVKETSSVVPSGEEKPFPLLEDILPKFSTTNLEELTTGSASLIISKAENVIMPAADALDEATGGWAMSYADLHPENTSTPVGQAFLASNIAYAAAGTALSMQGDLFLGLLIELVSVASFAYHYTQLDKDSKTDTVRFALFIDYVMAFTSIFVGLGYMLMDGQLPPIDGVISAAVGMSFFLLGLTVCAEGMAYVVVHSLWHVFSAYCAYVIGNTHLNIMGV